MGALIAVQSLRRNGAEVERVFPEVAVQVISVVMASGNEQIVALTAVQRVIKSVVGSFAVSVTLERVVTKVAVEDIFPGAGMR